MKRLSLFILAVLSSTMMFGQRLTLHYQADYSGCNNLYTKITGVYAVNGLEIYNGEGMQNQGGQNIEIGVFDQNNICRFTRVPQWHAKSNRYLYQMSIRGTEGMVYHFKVYDHNTDMETDLVDDFGQVIEYVPNAQIGSTTNPFVLNFTSPAGSGYELEVTGYGEDNANTNKGYYLIASPVTGAITPTSENHFITDNYDLYYFDQNHELEWVNFKDPDNGGWDITNGKGYLYASQTTTVLTFAGTPNTDGEVTLEYNEEAEFPGLNLVGNPLADDAYIGRGYYRMNRDTREGLVPAGADESIDAMEGIFVIAEEDGETMTFSTTPTLKLRTKLILNLQSSSATLIDRAIVNFENSQELPKIEILNSNSKIYFQKESHDLATLNAGDMGEIPVCFKAVKDGNYSLSFKSEEVTFTYLHLIDNKTGNDVNLLETPYYSFDATTTDYESRFRLVFATGSSVDGGNFGFVNSSGNFCIFGVEGEATVQVVDILGHMLSSETFSGSYEKKLNVAPGVYMLRLIQGKDVKVQKTVIK